MAEKRKRGQNFTPEEKEKLVKLLLEHKSYILNKKTDGCTNEAKSSAWAELAASFNASGSNYRSKESLMKVWEKLKTESKLYYSTSRRNSTQTGGGPLIIKTDPILDQVCSIMGRGCTGILAVNDSDSIAVTEEESLPKVFVHNNFHQEQTDQTIYPLVDVIESDYIVAEVSVEPENAETPTKTVIKTPLWSRRRPVSSYNNERSQAMGSLCSSLQNMNKKKEDVEDVKLALLNEELEFKKNFLNYNLKQHKKTLS